MAANDYDRGYEKGAGWLLFASMVLLIVGVFNVILGITLIAGDEIYVSGEDARVVLVGDVSGWGWILLIVGILEVIASFGVLVRSQAARWFGIIMAVLAALAHLPVLFGPEPLYSFLVVIMSILVIYGLAQYGGRERSVV
jgi:uncharacterized membrane protein HdeD (DUF308 family)